MPVVYITLKIGGLSKRVGGKCISFVLSYMPPLTIGGLSNHVGGSYNFDNWWTV